MHPLQTLALTFDLPLRHDELYAFRGAMAALAGREQDLFHNHDNSPDAEQTYRHRYPLVQYRVHGGRASLFSLNEGAEAVDALHLARCWDRFRLRGRPAPLRVTGRVRDRRFGLRALPEDVCRRYRIYRYVPLNSENYRAWKSTNALYDKVLLLERLLQNHLVAFAHAVGWELPAHAPLHVIVNDLDRVKKVNVLGTPLMAFDLVFSVNAVLPQGLGLGRKAAFGFGWLLPLPGN